MLKSENVKVQFDLTYQSEWQDGFGAQGWKLDVAMKDPQVIACTTYTGEKSLTSVLVHDILDHLVSGFWLSGYENEARATAMHGIRNGIEVRSSYEWMANEILSSKPICDNLTDYLPARISKEITAFNTNDEAVEFLFDNYGIAQVSNFIVEVFFRIGLSGVPIALARWQQQDLAFDRMHAIGLCLQSLLVDAQDAIANWNAEKASASIYLNNDACEFIVTAGDRDNKATFVRKVE